MHGLNVILGGTASGTFGPVRTFYSWENGLSTVEEVFATGTFVEVERMEADYIETAECRRASTYSLG